MRIDSFSLVCIAAVWLASLAYGQTPAPILILNSYHQGDAWSDDTVLGLRESLAKHSPPPDLYIEYLDARRRSEPAHRERFREYLRTKYANVRFRIILATDDAAVKFLLSVRDDLYRSIPIVFTGVNEFQGSADYLLKPSLPPGFTGVLETFENNETLVVARKLHPATRHIFLVGELDSAGQVRDLHRDVDVRYIETDKVTLEELAQTIATIPADSIVQLRRLNGDRQGKLYSTREAARILSERSPAPIYSVSREAFGNGIVGGQLNRGYWHGLEGGKIARRVLVGERPESIGARRESGNMFHFDYRQLQRWDIPESALPSPHLIEHRPLSFYSQYREIILTVAIALVVQAVVIFFLMASVFKGRKVRLSLEQSEQQRDLALRAGNMGTWRWESASGRMDLSPVHQHLFRLDDTFTGTLDAMLARIELAHRERFKEKLRRSIDSGEDYHDEYQVSSSDGSSRWMVSQGQPYRDEKGATAGITGVTWDISERKFIERLDTSHAQELQRSNEELERFAYVASHDLQEPLRMIRSYSVILERHLGSHLDQDAREFLDYIVDGATRMDQLIRDLLAYSRVSHHQEAFAPVSLARSLEEALHLLQSSIRDSDAEISSGDLPLVNAVAPQMVQLFQNLIGNAIKYREPSRPLRIHISSAEIGGAWRLAVEDNGIGVPEEQGERIFGLFKRLHTRAIPGTGIGLALCRKIVENHGGKIWVEGADGGGSRFCWTHVRTVKTGP